MADTTTTSSVGTFFKWLALIFLVLASVVLIVLAAIRFNDSNVKNRLININHPPINVAAARAPQITVEAARAPQVNVAPAVVNMTQSPPIINVHNNVVEDEEAE